MKHLLKYRIRSLMRGRVLLFWTFLFPLVLTTLFHFAFSQLESDTPFEPIPVAVVDNGAYRGNVPLQKTLEEVGKKGENQLLVVTIAGEEQAKALLKDGKVEGILSAGEEISLTVKESGISQTILKAFLDEFQRTSGTIANILAEHPEQAASLLQKLGDSRSFTKEISLSKASPDTTINYFFTVIAMTCMYGGLWGIESTTEMQPNLSPLGARRSLGPVPKRKIILADQIAMVLIQFVIILLVLLYMAVPLGVPFGNQWGYLIFACFTGCVFGVALGNCIGVLSTKSENAKTAWLLVISMTGSFLAGMMIVNMKDIVSHRAPFLNYINPCALLTDSFYALYMYDTHTRFFLNMGILWAFSIVLLSVSVLKLRRQKYASI